MPKQATPTVLIVEDEPLVRMVASNAFEDEGFIVVEAEHAVDALSLFIADGSINLLFTDVNMPGALTGIDLAERILALQPSICILITSALPLQRSIRHIGASFLAKPYSPENLMRTGRGLLAA